MRRMPSKHEFLSKNDDGKPFFDIIADTSIGITNITDKISLFYGTRMVTVDIALYDLTTVRKELR